MSDQRFVTAPRSRYSPAQIRLRLALYLDGLGREAEAIPVYEEALSLGLKGMDRRDAFVCLASSLRNVGKSHKAVRHLESARMKFPRDAVVNLFLALALYDVKQYKKAIQILGFALLDEIRGSNVERYQKVLRSRYKYLKG